MLLSIAKRVAIYAVCAAWFYGIADYLVSAWRFHHERPQLSPEDLYGEWRIDDNSLTIFTAVLKNTTRTNSVDHILRLNLDGTCEYNGDGVYRSKVLFRDEEDLNMFYSRHHPGLDKIWDLESISTFGADYVGSSDDECYGVRCHYHLLLRYPKSVLGYIGHIDYFHIGYDANGVFLWKSSATNHDVFGPHKIVFRKAGDKPDLPSHP